MTPTCKHVALRTPDGRCLVCPPPSAELKFTPELATELLRETRAVLARRKFSYFFRAGWHVLEPATPLLDNWHIDVVCDHVQWLLTEWLKHKRDPSYIQQIKSLLVNIPPGTAKSRIVSVYAPAWMWLHCPEWRVMCLSSNPNVAIRDAMYSRELIASQWYQQNFKPDWEIRGDQDAKGKFENTAGGFRVSKGLEAMVTGDRADALFCDDPHDAQGVHSKIQRQAVIDRWDQAVRNRVNEPAHSIRLLIMQRLHEDDLSGHWLRQGGSEHLCLPMEFEPERQCKTGLPWTDTRAPGECLHPKRFPPVTLQEEKKALGSMGYAGQMQQRPAPAEGGMFRRDSWGWFRLDGAVPTRARPSGTSDRECRVIGYSKNGQIALDRIVLSVDASFKKTEDGSRVSAQVIGAKGADRFVLDNVTKPMDFTQTCECILALIAKWPDITKVLIEDKANGPAIINHLSSKVQGIIPIEPEGGKEARAAAIQPQVESGNVYLMEGAAWADDFVHELGTFPNGAKDDQVDALSQALIYLNQKGWRTIMLGRL